MNSMKLMKIMKLGIRPLGIFAFCLLSLIPKSQAQTFIVSNLDQGTSFAFTESPGVGGRWASTSFRTSSQPAWLDRLTIDLKSYDGPDYIALYGNSITNTPTNNALDGDGQLISSELFRFENPTEDEDLETDNRFRLTPTGGSQMLAADTTYWLVFASPNDDYEYGFMSSMPPHGDTGSYGWQIGSFSGSASSDRGVTWAHSISGHARFGIEGRIIPEPSTYAIVGGICLIGFVAFRRIRIAKIAKSSS